MLNASSCHAQSAGPLCHAHAAGRRASAWRFTTRFARGMTGVCDALGIIVFLFLSSSIFADEHQPCQNCTAFVEIDWNGWGKQFQEALVEYQNKIVLSQWMPLDSVYDISSTHPLHAVVKVFTDPMYAANNEVDSFDVAKVADKYAREIFKDSKVVVRASINARPEFPPR